MQWFWRNTVQVAFGAGAVKNHLKEFVKPSSKVLCTFGGGSIDANGCRKDVQAALDDLKCEVKWEGGIPPNPEYDRLVEIAAVARTFKPDLILAVGGGSVLDGTKFLSLAAGLDEGLDPFNAILAAPGAYKGTPFPVGSVITLPATGSEWNCGYVISRRSMSLKVAGFYNPVFPVFSLIDPQYTMSLPVRQLRNGVFDAMAHCIDQFLTPQRIPMMDRFWMSVMKELVDIGADVVKEGSSLELHERLIMAASFGLNIVFTLGKESCWGIHMMGHQLTAKYGIDHGATLAICACPWLEKQFEARKELLAECAEYVFGVRTGTVEEKAHAFITELDKFIGVIGQPKKVTDVEGVTIADGDAAVITKMVMDSMGGQPFGYHGCGTEDVVKDIMTKVVV